MTMLKHSGSQKTWKLLRRWEYQATLPTFWEISMQIKKQQLELDMEQWTGCKLGKEYLICKVYYEKHWAGWSTSWNQDCRDTTLIVESKELKSLLRKVKEESEKVGLKLNIQKMKIMASSPITSWQIDGETMETVRDFIFLGSKITVDGDCRHEIKKTLTPWKEIYDQPR